MSNDNQFCVYKHISPEGKIYIGISSQKKPEYRWGKDGKGYEKNKSLYEDIQKFGWDNFNHEVIAQNLSEVEAVIIESSLIKATQSNNPFIGYNQNEGGRGAYKTLQIKGENNNVYLVNIYKNQKIIQIHRIKGGINFKANFKAMETLSTCAYILYMYLMIHDDSMVWALSSKDVYKRTHLTETTYPKSVQELIEKGYLVPGEIQTLDGKFSENVYHLFEDPEYV